MTKETTQKELNSLNKIDQMRKYEEKEKRKMESFDFMLRSEIQSAAFDTSLVMALLKVVKQ
jgi:hypothetical protein